MSTITGPTASSDAAAAGTTAPYAPTSLGAVRPLARPSTSGATRVDDPPAAAPPSIDSPDPAERRKARKAARAAIPPPERDPAYDHLSLDDVRTLRAALTEEETRVSYWRRIVQARLDLVRARSHGSSAVHDLSHVLADAGTAHHRLVHLSVSPAHGVPPLPDLAELWTREADPDDDRACRRLELDLTAAEERLSAHRRELHQRLDATTRELIARYRENPMLALAVLPRDPSGF